jgi:DNA-binding response OmpR family regulator
MCGYRPIIATTGHEALARARAHPDLIILDINLPDLDGVEVCRRIRKADGAVPVLFITAATGRRRREALAAGGSGFLEKPFDVDELLDTIERLLAAGRERRTGRERRSGRVDGYGGPDRRRAERRAPWSGTGAAANGSAYGRRPSALEARGHGARER